MELFEGKKTVKICAPMVRYSKVITSILVSILEYDRVQTRVDESKSFRFVIGFLIDFEFGSKFPFESV